MKNRKVHLPYFTFIIILLNLIGCSSPTEAPKGNLTGMVNLEGLSDHSGITIALYDLAYLDTTIVRINNQYPQIGVHINQHTEFDHRLQSTIKSSETLADGSFEIKKIPTGVYNIVAIKDGWGFKYLYEIEIIEGENDLSDVIPLYEEIHISGNISDNIVVATDHHLVIYDDTDFVPNISSLTIQPGAVIRIDPGVDLIIHGTLSAQGEENNMFWVTSNDGFDNSPLSSDDIERYNSMEISNLAQVEDDLIEWGKWDYANTCLSNQINNLHMQNGIYRKGNCGFISSFVDSTFCSNLICENIATESGAGIYYDNVSNGLIEKNVVSSCEFGMEIKANSSPTTKNNYISGCNYGIRITYSSFPQVKNNELTDCYYGIFVKRYSSPLIYYNNINSNICIITYQSYSAGLEVHYNNLEFTSNSFWVGLSTYTDYNAESNYFFTIDDVLIQESIYDKNDLEPSQQQYYCYVNYIPFLTQIVQNAGIQE
jgi:parallel beta-helix repeat protein